MPERTIPYVEEDGHWWTGGQIVPDQYFMASGSSLDELKERIREAFKEAGMEGFLSGDVVYQKVEKLGKINRTLFYPSKSNNHNDNTYANRLSTNQRRGRNQRVAQ